MQSYADKDTTYFNNARKDIESLLSAKAARVLEVGCGSGATLAWLKATGRCESTTGIELFEGAAQQARTCVDNVYCGPAERMLLELPEGEQFDLVLCLDVLEHMVDPWEFLSALQPYLRPGGQLIVSVPNVRFIGVLGPLMFRGEWRYRDAGVLDRTHLRFFTRSSAVQLVASGGMSITGCQGNPPPLRTGVGRFDQLSLGLFTEFTAFQWVVSACKPEGRP